MPKVDKYRGKVKEELEGLTIEEFMPLLTSRARRALRRATTKAGQLRKLIKKASKLKSTNPGKVIRTHMREAVIIPAWLGMTFAVHNGKEWKSVVITVDKLGYRLGDFSHTTGRVLHSGPGVGATRGSKFIPLK
ncbi:TPA: 30S ribosomal protein S19 [Candidatus Micrarchaeota archaeon]|nr:ribosomal protein S19/S15 [uncultured archaeon]HIH29834.1 30S ribosomal protein S19 [Candidatus Micrarchaeota archaeon]